MCRFSVVLFIPELWASVCPTVLKLSLGILLVSSKNLGGEWKMHLMESIKQSAADIPMCPGHVTLVLVGVYTDCLGHLLHFSCPCTIAFLKKVRIAAEDHLRLKPWSSSAIYM